MKQYLDNIRNGREVRESLASLCGLLRTAGDFALSAADAEALVVSARDLLTSDDPKIRKNAAKLLGILKGVPETGYSSDTLVFLKISDKETVDCLVEAYRREQTRFVRSAYLEAMRDRDISAHVDYLKEKLSALRETPVTDENRKHTNEEIAALQKLLGDGEEAPQSHRFAGYGADNTILFVVNPFYREMFAESLGGMRKKVVNGGVVVRTSKLTEILTNRIWREAVFRVPDALTVPCDPYEAAVVLAGETVGEYIASRLRGEGPVRYRIDYRCRDESAKNKFIKRISQETDRLSCGKLRNEPGDYEVTFRISETEAGMCRLGILFAGLRDDRFAYRKETVAGSLHPTDAAAVIEAAKPYLTDNSQLLDPFCGAGTMIAERLKAGKVRSAFGVDTFGQAIEKAHVNVKASNAWFIHRDFFDYRQDHMFDEIITNMPFREGGADDEIASVYRRFFRKIPEHLRESGTIVMVSHDPRLAEASIPADMTIEKKLPMRDRGEMAAYIIRFRGLA